MGNFNSGNRKAEKKGLVTEYRFLDSYTIKQAGQLQATIGEAKQIINIVYNDKKRHGGKVHYVECPVCKVRVRFLYARKNRFACRTCQDLTYESSQCKNKNYSLAKSILKDYNFDPSFVNSFFRPGFHRNK